MIGEGLEVVGARELGGRGGQQVGAGAEPCDYRGRAPPPQRAGRRPCRPRARPPWGARARGASRSWTRDACGRWPSAHTLIQASRPRERRRRYTPAHVQSRAASGPPRLRDRVPGAGNPQRSRPSACFSWAPWRAWSWAWWRLVKASRAAARSTAAKGMAITGDRALRRVHPDPAGRPGIVAAIAIPSLLRARVSANEAAAIGDVREVITAEARYQKANAGYFDRLECLAAPETVHPRSSRPFGDRRIVCSRRQPRTRAIAGPSIPDRARSRTPPELRPRA